MSGRPRLSLATLGQAGAGVALPGYDRAAVRVGIVHLGVGAYHRAHQAVFADDALGRGELGWGIVGASLRSADTRDALEGQDGLYGFVLRDGTTTRLRVIGSLLRVIVAPEAPEALIAALADPGVRLVTLTITEKGYALDQASWALDRTDPAVAQDLAGAGPPRSALGFLAAGLARRRASGAGPVAIVSCDNLPNNGRVLQRVLTEFIGMNDPALAAALGGLASFPSSMVDRIVPATTAADRAAVAEALGLEDAWPVVAEPAFAWIIEDRFPGGRPPFEQSGVRFVADVEPYEQMKLWLLNGAHTAIAAIGRLAGFATVAEAMAEPRLRRYLECYWDEAMPTLSTDPAIAAAYRAALPGRFANPALAHRCGQIATDASQKLPQRLLAPLRARLAAGAPAPAILFAVAAWVASCRGVDDGGVPYEVVDAGLNRWPGRPEPGRWGDDALAAMLGFRAVFGDDLPGDRRVTGPLAEDFAAISTGGVLAALDRRFGGPA